MKCSVYKAFDRDGDVLYIGITGSKMRRLSEHRRESEWWEKAARIDLEHFEEREEALAREAELVGQLRPPYNRTLRGEPFAMPGYLSVADMAEMSPISPTAIRRAALEGEIENVIWVEEKFPFAKEDDFRRWIFGDRQEEK